ncbi:MAG: molybdenum cofactor guanylyltransferase [Thermaerobacter sp.]|nr:molybdenum cofactor guanylyltransferase [Thermaerobacter sp.]
MTATLPRLRMDGLVLAGGRSRRMGRNKSDLPWTPGPTLLSHARETLSQAVCGRVFVARPYGAPRVEPVDLPDPCDARGPLAGIWSGLRHSRGPFLAVLAVDLPMVPPSLYTQLSRYLSLGVAGVFPVAGEQRQPLAGFWSVGLASAAAAVLCRHRPPSLFGFLESHRVVWVPVPHASWLTNLNTPQDWLTWHR